MRQYFVNVKSQTYFGFAENDATTNARVGTTSRATESFLFFSRFSVLFFRYSSSMFFKSSYFFAQKNVREKN